ncbi:MAG: hypothetical protein PF501_07210 [Salinisphaera sp.]|jgi:hypothetical protein|nr:hypothetical protein [Salinisphaera sp.]
MKSTDHQSAMLRFAKAMKPNTMVKALSGAPVIWYWMANDGSSANNIHRLFSQQSWREDGLAGGAVLAAGSLFMLPVLLGVATGYTWRCGARVKRETGKSAVRQWREQIRLGCQLAVPPPWYYIFEFYRDDHRRRASHYLYRSETKSGIYDMLRKRRDCEQTTEALRDKAGFVRRCQAHGLSVVDTLATVSDGVIESFDGSSGLALCDLFFKPAKGAGGRGASRWLYQGDEHYLASNGESVSREDLETHVRALSQDERYVVRRHLRSHPDILDLTPGALSTARVVTCLNEEGQPEVTHAVFRMARSANVVVDNFHAGGIAACIDLASGQLGMASDMGLRADSDWWASHPTTGAAIEGRTLPHWDAVVALALGAHAAFADQVAIGWDIAILADGPCLIEGNKSPDLDIVQRTSGQPAGNSRLGQLLSYHLTDALSH